MKSKFDRRPPLHNRINRNTCSQANLVLPNFPLTPPLKGVGLCNNTGVDCFINSTLQCLMHTQPFANFLERSCSGFCGLRELSILRMCALRAKYTIRNRDLHRNIKVIDPCADAYSQNDAFLFLCGLISNHIERCCNSLQITSMFFDRVFKTTWRNEVICTACSHKSITYKQEQAIQVGLGKMLIGSVRDWAGPYPLNDYKCDKCNRNTCSQKCHLTRLPEILIIQVKRFRYDRGLQRSVKANNYMSYSEILDMSEFCENPDEDARYRLSASIVHVGSTPRSGHYYAYAKTASGWVKFNDSLATNVLLETTLRDKPYILFYTKENTSTVVSSSSSDMKSNTSSSTMNTSSSDLKTPRCNTVKHVSEKFNKISLNGKVPYNIQSSAAENMVSIKTDMPKDLCNNKNSSEIVDVVKNDNKNEQAISKKFEKMKIDESNNNIGSKEPDVIQSKANNIKSVSGPIEIPEQTKNDESIITTNCLITLTTMPSDQENLQTIDTPQADSLSLKPVISMKSDDITMSMVASSVKTTEVVKNDLVEKVEKSFGVSTLRKRKERVNDYEQNIVNKKKLNKLISNVQLVNGISQEHISIEEWQVQKIQQNTLSNPIINNQFSIDTSRTMVNGQFVNIATIDQKYNENSTTTSFCNKVPNFGNIYIIEYEQCRWVVENIPSINSLNDEWKMKFSRIGNNTIRKKRKRRFRNRARWGIQNLQEKSPFFTKNLL
ncbi:4488_t:CDS:2 [Gigaspora margarita]|uniref:ubiquitinyl hydrolase 1 n=1 Tax=Gigaspora margarita TaxID=4874 RepID=A0ABN7V3T2_GIGMA|nr:4488_t:CDS:2 [Gigaspora margarita]